MRSLLGGAWEVPGRRPGRSCLQLWMSAGLVVLGAGADLGALGGVTAAVVATEAAMVEPGEPGASSRRARGSSTERRCTPSV